MKSVVLHAPVATLGAAATSRPTPTTTGKGRVTQVVPDAHGVTTILVVGASHCGKSSLVNALLGAPAVAPAGGSALISIPRPAGRLATPSALTAPSALAAAGSATGSPAGSGRGSPAGSGPGSGPGSGAPAGARSVAATGSASGAMAAGDPVDHAAGALVVRPVTSAYLSFHYADSPAAFGYVPGHRGPRPLGLAELRDGDQATVVRGGPGRPPRRIDVLHPADLLRRVNLVDTPGVGGFDQAYTEIVLDALDDGAGLLFVADASTALQAAELDFLSQVEQREVPVTFVLTKIDAHPEWPAVLSANLKLVHDHAPGLAAASWYALSTLPDRDTAPPAVVEEAALGLAGVGVAALRRGLAEPPPVELADPPADPPAVVPSGPAQRVSAAATDTRWSEVLDRELRSRSVAVGQRLAIDLATIHVRCVQETSGETGCARLPHAFDRELHALSVRTTNAIETAATEIMRLVFAEILDGEPDAAALARIRRATRRAVEDADGAPEWDRVLLVTATSGIAVTAGRGAVASLAAIRPRPLDEALLPPVGVGLSAGCYAAWRGGGDRKQCRSWLQQAIHVLEGSLERECTARFDHLRDALSVVAADTIDHGVLLA